MAEVQTSGTGGARSIVYLSNYVTPDGLTSDLVGLTAALTACPSGGELVAEPGKTYRVPTNGWVIDKSITLVLYGATIQKLDAATGNGVLVKADNVTIYGGTLDGDQAGGASGPALRVDPSGASALNCRLFGTRLVNTKAAAGVIVSGGGQVYCYGTYTAFNYDTAAAGGNGYWCGASSTLVMDSGCYAEYCTREGVQIDGGANTGCVVRGKAYRCANGGSACGARIQAASGSIDFIAEECGNFGILFDTGADNWRGYVEAINTGKAFNAGGINFAGDSAGTSCRVATVACKLRVVSKSPRGYSLALVAGSLRGDFWLDADAIGAADSDPGLHFSGGANYHRVRGSVRGHTVGVIMGEGNATLNTDNDVDLYIEGCTGSAVQLIAAVANKIRADIRDCLNSAPPIYGLVDLSTANTYGNDVEIVSNRETSGGAVTTTCPVVGVRCDASTLDNRVTFYGCRDVRILALDLGTNNVIRIEKPVRVTLLTSFESAEAWSNAATNSTAGQYVDGNAGKRIVGGAGTYTSSFLALVGGPYDLSAMGNDEWFRLWVNVENFSDAGGTPLLVRLYSNGSAYFQNSTGVLLANGGSYIMMRKVDFTLTNAPVWTTITYGEILVKGVAGTFAVTVDDLSRVHPRQVEALQNIARPVSSAITVGTSPFVYTIPRTLGVDLAAVQVTGGTVSKIERTSDGTFYDTLETAGVFVGKPGDSVKVTWSVIPTMNLLPTR